MALVDVYRLVASKRAGPFHAKPSEKETVSQIDARVERRQYPLNSAEWSGATLCSSSALLALHPSVRSRQRWQAYSQPTFFLSSRPPKLPRGSCKALSPSLLHVFLFFLIAFSPACSQPTYTVS